MDVDQLVKGIGEAVAAAQAQSDCGFLCMTKSEWAAWIQTLGSIFALILTGYLARRSFIKQATHTNLINERGFLVNDYELSSDHFNICEFVKYSTENAKSLLLKISPMLGPQDDNIEALNPAEALLVIDGIMDNLMSLDTMKIVESGCYKEYAQLKLNLKKIKSITEEIETDGLKTSYKPDLSGFGDWKMIMKSIDKCISTIDITINIHSKRRDNSFGRRVELDKKINALS